MENGQGLFVCPYVCAGGTVDATVGEWVSVGGIALGSLSLSLSLPLSLSVSVLSHSHSHSHCLSLSHTHTHAHTVPLSSLLLAPPSSAILRPRHLPFFPRSPNIHFRNKDQFTVLHYACYTGPVREGDGAGFSFRKMFVRSLLSHGAMVRGLWCGGGWLLLTLAPSIPTFAGLSVALSCTYVGRCWMSLVLVPMLVL